ncbi:MAG TPA: triose-phosphate isomerase [Candidatus Binatia bacterium]|nr:triose-phosphate isomerase [Candidatus Binatia bacterium]
MVTLIGNWKMQLSESESETLAKEIVRLWAAQGANKPQAAVVICPSHMALEECAKATKGTPVALGGQDVFWEDKGAFTGEISPKTLKELGCEYCIVGHSERRQHLGETDEMVNKKVLALLRHGITPVVCVGETLEERSAGRRDAVVIAQVRTALANAKPVGSQRVIVAYEPRWVIGTGKAVSPQDAAEMHHLILGALEEMLTADTVKERCSVIYGGAVDAKNIAGFLAVDVIRGALVGGASLKPQEFAAMAEIAADAA